MSTEQKEINWKKTFDVIKAVLMSGVIGIGFKVISLGITITIAFTTLHDDVERLKAENKVLFTKSDRDIQEHEDLVRDINTIKVQIAKQK